MSTSEAAISAGAAAEPRGSGGGKKKAIIFIVLGLLLVGLGGGAGWFFMHKKGEHGAVSKPRAVTNPVFVTLEPFVVNLSGDVQRYLQVGIDLRVSDSKVGDAIKVHLPEIRNGILLLLSNKTADELGSAEGKNRLRHEIRAAVNKPLGFETPPAGQATPAAPPQPGSGDAHAAETAPPAGPPPEEATEGVQDVLLTSFVIQ
jgi:flagellar FliL protein